MCHTANGKAHVLYKRNARPNLSNLSLILFSGISSGLFTPNDVDNLVQEVLKMHTLSHPNVMPLTGVCLDTSGGPAVVMPFMDNGSVLHYVKKERGKLVPPDDSDCSVVCTVIIQIVLNTASQLHC